MTKKIHIVSHMHRFQPNQKKNCILCTSVPNEQKQNTLSSQKNTSCPICIGSNRTKKNNVVTKKTHRVPCASVPTEQKNYLLPFNSVHDHCSAPTALGALRGVFPKLADGRRPVTAPLSRRQPPVTMLVWFLLQGGSAKPNFQSWKTATQQLADILDLLISR